MMAAGFGFKIAAVPFQMWVPDVYEGAPIPIAGFLAVASKAGGFAVLLRVFHTSFGSPPIQSDWTALFAALAVASMVLGNVVAMQQTNIKRLMGYSSIAQAGYLLIGLATATPSGRDGVLFFLGAYALTTLAAFLAITAISHRLDSDEIADYAGLWRRSPYLALALALALFSLIGLPPTGGFWAKIYLFSAAVEGGLAWLALLGVLNSVVSAYYYLRPVKAMFLEPAATETSIKTVPTGVVGLGIAALGTLLLGLLPTPLLDIAIAAGSSLVP
jgi:NADH-quinone oxidoreductase subunit N